MDNFTIGIIKISIANLNIAIPVNNFLILMILSVLVKTTYYEFHFELGIF